MTDTARTLVTEALREARIIAKDETPSDDEAASTLTVLNRMLDSWSVENIMVYAQVEESFAISAGDGSYTIGAGGDFNTARPTRITDAWVRDSNGYDTGLDVIGIGRYGGIRAKSLQGIPSVLNYTPSYPLATIRLSNVPQNAATLFLVSDKQLTQFASLNTAYAFPPGYKEAIVTNLAVRRCISAGKTPRDDLKDIAISSKDAVRRVNLPEVVMTYDGPGRSGLFNINTGGFS